MRNDPSFYGGIPTVPQYQGGGQIDPRLVSTSEGPQGGPNWEYGGLLTYEKAIKEFYGDIPIPVNAAGSQTTLRAGTDLPNNCVGIRFIALIPGVSVSINGGGVRTVLNNDVLSGCEIQSITIFTDALGTCIVQAVGTGD